MKISQYIAAGMVAGSLVTVSTVNAATQCTISGTGPDSTNKCTEKIGNTCVLTNDNRIFITGSNQQTGQSGGAGSSGSTEGGDAVTGDVYNANDVVVSGTINNDGACAAQPVVPPAPTPTPVPGQPGGQVESARISATPQVKAPVGGVNAGAGGTDRTGAIISALVAGTAAIGFGLSRLSRQE